MKNEIPTNEINCIYCSETSFVEGEGSREHAILSAIGGQKFSRNVCCHVCNTKLGNHIDNQFAEKFAIIYNLLNITTGRGRQAPVIQKQTDKNGELFNLLPGGKPYPASISPKFTDKEDGGVQITVKARSEEEAARLVGQYLSSQGLTETNLTINQTIERIESVDIEVGQHLELNTNEDCRCLAKMCLTYFATQVNPSRLRNGCCSRLIEYIKGGLDDKSLVKFTSSFPFPVNDQFPEYSHTVGIACFESQHKAFGYIQLFGTFGFIVNISEEWSGGNLSSTHWVDPVSTTTSEESRPVSYEQFASESLPDQRILIERLTKLFEIIEAKRKEQLIADLIVYAIAVSRRERGVDNAAEISVDDTPFIADVIARFFHNFPIEYSIDIIDLIKKAAK